MQLQQSNSSKDAQDALLPKLGNLLASFASLSARGSSAFCASKRTCSDQKQPEMERWLHQGWTK
jgi:hypothetical protein